MNQLVAGRDTCCEKCGVAFSFQNEVPYMATCHHNLCWVCFRSTDPCPICGKDVYYLVNFLALTVMKEHEKSKKDYKEILEKHNKERREFEEKKKAFARERMAFSVERKRFKEEAQKHSLERLEWARKELEMTKKTKKQVVVIKKSNMDCVAARLRSSTRASAKMTRRIKK